MTYTRAYASHHDVRSDLGATLARYADRITYKPGTVLTILDRSTPRGGGGSNHWDYRVVLEIKSWREDSTLDWGPAARAAWAEAARIGPLVDYGRHLSESRPLSDHLVERKMGRRMIPIVLSKVLTTDRLATFADFVLEVRRYLTELELHEMDEWIRVDEGVLPFDPHRGAAGPSGRAFLAEREQPPTPARGPEPPLEWVDEVQRYFQTGQLDPLTPQQVELLKAMRQRLPDPMVAYRDVKIPPLDQQIADAPDFGSTQPG